MKNQSSSPSTTGELIPAAPQAERATANALRTTAIRVPNLNQIKQRQPCGRGKTETERHADEQRQYRENVASLDQ